MNNVKSIDIVLENCEVYTFHREDIGDFEISDIREEIFRCACNAINKYFEQLVLIKLIKQIHSKEYLKEMILHRYTSIMKMTLKNSI